MRILISGSSGFIGSALTSTLVSSGHTVLRLVRSPEKLAGDIFWNPDQGRIDTSNLEGMDAVVHLAGESIASGWWTAQKKDRIRETRVKGTKLLSDALTDLKKPPSVFISASAIGIYGDRGAEILKENSLPGKDFLAGVCQEWEAAPELAARKGIRVVNPRFGIVLGKEGGALAKMLYPFKLGVGGKIGSGEQYMSWITIDDVVGALQFALMNEKIKGPINVVAPHPVTNVEFTKILGKTISRPTIFPLPAFVAHWVMGEMADVLLLSSARVEPAQLLEKGYVFKFPQLEPALRHLLK